MGNCYDGMRVAAADELIPRDSAVQGMRFVQVNECYKLPRFLELPREAVDQGLRRHPRRVGYNVPANYRAAAHALANPDCVLTGFGALSLYGLPHFADSCDTVLLNPRISKNRLGGATSPGIGRGQLKPGEAWTLRLRDAEVRVAAPPVALAHALKALRRGECGWETIRIEGFDPQFIQAVQLVDSARRFVGLDGLEVLATGLKTIKLPWLASVLAHSSALADSPKETEMRLLTSLVAERHGLTMREQVPVRDGNRIITRFDLALMEPKIGLMYDGAHHWDNRQRQKDARINLEVTRFGWKPLRFAANSLVSLPQMVDGLVGHL